MSKRRVLSGCWVVLFASACGGGAPSPPGLAYGAGPEGDFTYVRADTTHITASMMGQSMAIEQFAEMTLGIAMTNVSDGVDLRVSVVDLDGRISQPLGAPLSVDESSVDGEFVFALDRRGRATITTLPNVDLEASQMVSGSALAHGLFPRLPGTALDPGESWVDTLSFDGEDAAGLRTEETITTYTVEGPAVFEGRSALRIGLTGTTQLANEFEMGGMQLSQESEVEFDGHVIWDHQRGMVLEHVRRARGSGEVDVPVAPVPLPIRIESTQVTRLGGM